MWLAASAWFVFTQELEVLQLLNSWENNILKSHWSTVTLHERFVFAQSDSSQEFLDAKKLYYPETTKMLQE